MAAISPKVNPLLAKVCQASPNMKQQFRAESESACFPAAAHLGNAKPPLSNAKPHLGNAKPHLGNAKPHLGNA